MGQRETANINQMIMIFRKWDLVNLITYIIRGNINLSAPTVLETETYWFLFKMRSIETEFKGFEKQTKQ